LRRLDLSAGATLVSAATLPAPATVRQALGLRCGARVHEIVRIRSANGTPILLEETYLPATLFPGLLAADLTGSVYALMSEQFDTALSSADEHIEATPATAARAELLGVSAGDPLLLVTRTAFDRDGTAVEFSHDYFRSDRSRIRIKSWGDRDTQARVETSPAS